MANPTRWMLALGAASTLLLTAACTVGPGPGSTPTPTPTTKPTPTTTEAVFGDELPCESPTTGWARFEDEAAERGLTDALPFWAVGTPHHVVVEDLDGDGDLDLLWWSNDSVLQVFHNDGRGQFTLVPDAATGINDRSPALLVAHVTGDRLPDLVISRPGALLVRENVAGAFGPPTELRYAPSEDSDVVQVLAAGDVDGDGDLDLLAPGLMPGTSQPGDPPSGTLDRLLLMEDGALDEVIELQSDEGTIVLAATLTDFDFDGDLDVLAPSDLRLPAALWRNDGGSPPVFVEVAQSLSANIAGGYMAIDSADLNGDGLLDYCFADTEPPTCLASTGGGPFLETHVAWGLSIDEPVGLGTVGWGFDFADLDGDGWLDIVQVAGAMQDADAALEWQDLVWAGGPGPSFDDVSTETGIDSRDDNYGQVVADLDEDGWLDILVLGPNAPPRLWLNQCGDGDWLEVDLDGPDGNPDGIGARVELEAGARSMVREVSTARGMSQGPSRVHFTFTGEAATALVVRWPDGAETRIEDPPARRKVRVVHPDRVR